MKLFKSKGRNLEADIESYLDIISNSGLMFTEGVKHYVAGKIERFESQRKKLTELEGAADDLRRSIKYQLYRYMLIPQSRGDVLGIIENLDEVIDIAETVLEQISIEKPYIPQEMSSDFYELAKLSNACVESIVKGTRAFFHEFKMVNDYVNKVLFYEHEADDLEEHIKRKAFNSKELDSLSLKVHIRYFSEQISGVADAAENVAERLSIYAIKRKL